MIPRDLVAQTSTYLHERSGAALVQRSYPHGHTISGREIDDIAAWFAAM